MKQGLDKSSTFNKNRSKTTKATEDVLYNHDDQLEIVYNDFAQASLQEEQAKPTEQNEPNNNHSLEEDDSPQIKRPVKRLSKAISISGQSKSFRNNSMSANKLRRKQIEEIMSKSKMKKFQEIKSSTFTKYFLLLKNL